MIACPYCSLQWLGQLSSFLVSHDCTINRVLIIIITVSTELLQMLLLLEQQQISTMCNSSAYMRRKSVDNEDMVPLHMTLR